MTWTLQLTGHTPSKEKEAEVLKAIKKTVSGLHDMEAGILSGQFSGTFGNTETFEAEREGEK